MFTRNQNLNYTLASDFVSYRSKPDKTMAGPNVMVSPSQNTIINDQKKVETREGYTLDGPSNSSLNPIESGFTWATSTGEERVLRGYDDELEVRFEDASGDVNWVRVADSWSSVDFDFDTWWDDTEKLEVLLFVNGDDNVYEWGGGVAEVDSVTSNSITKKGTKTWAEVGFYTAANQTIIIDGTEFTYTGGEGTTTLTGVTPDPSSNGVSDGDIATQKMVTNANTPGADANNDAIGVLNNQLYVLDHESNEVDVSKDDDYTDFTFSSPRLPGEGELLILDSPGRAAIPMEQDMLIATIDDDWYRTDFQQLEVSSNLVETLNVKKLRTGTGKGLKEKNLVANFGTAVIYISNDNELESIERTEELELAVTQSLSDPIKPDFDDEDFSNGHVFTHKNRIYVASPVNSKVYILEFRQGVDGLVRFWQPPQILPVRRLVTVENDLYGHSNSVPETYDLFEGTDDNGNPFLARAAFSYRSYGDRAVLKTMNEWLTEGYISSNTELELTLKFDLDGETRELSTTIIGGDSNILFGGDSGSSLGDDPFGDEPLGISDSDSGNPKLRHIFPFPPKDFFEVQAVYETDSGDEQFELLAIGGNVRMSDRQPSWLKRQKTQIQ